MLDEVRRGALSDEKYDLLMTRSSLHVSAAERLSFANALRIIATNKGCRAVNREFLRKVGQPIVRINAVHRSGSSEAKNASFDACNLHSALFICIGARVRLTRTLSLLHGLTNGAVGIVRALIYLPDIPPPDLPAYVVVQFVELKLPFSCLPDVPNCVALNPRTHSWTGTVACSRQQIPLTLGWGITIHKAEGKTLKKVFIDTQSKTFAPEMLYVALTRVKRLKDLLVVPFSKEFVNELHTKDIFKQRMFEYHRLHHLERKTLNKWKPLDAVSTDLQARGDDVAEHVKMDVDSEVMDVDDKNAEASPSSDEDAYVDRSTQHEELLMYCNQSDDVERARTIKERLQAFGDADERERFTRQKLYEIKQEAERERRRRDKQEKDDDDEDF